MIRLKAADLERGVYASPSSRATWSEYTVYPSHARRVRTCSLQHACLKDTGYLVVFLFAHEIAEPHFDICPDHSDQLRQRGEERPRYRVQDGKSNVKLQVLASDPSQAILLSVLAATLMKYEMRESIFNTMS